MALESLPKIAPALFSAEQDLIQIYNKKSDTTGVINPSYIKSSPSGVAGAIQFSDGSAFASSSNLTWNNATNALGLGSGTTSAFIDFASNPAGSTTIVGAVRTYVDGVNLSEVMSFREDGRIGVLNTNPAYTFDVNGTINTRFAFNQDSANANTIAGIINQGGASQAVLGINCLRLNAQVSMMVGAAQAPTATLHVKGSGSTSATTSLLVQNSAGNPIFQATDDRTFTTNGLVTRLSSSEVFCGALALNVNSIGATGTGIYSTGTDGKVVIATSRQGALIANYAGALIALLNSDNPKSVLQIASGFSNGNTDGLTGNALYLTPQYNFTGSSLSNTVRGIYYNPTLTSLVSTTHYGIQTTSGGAYINTTTPQASACLQADSTTQGFLPPRVTTAQKNAIATPAAGLVVFDTDLNKLCVRGASAWETITSV